MIGSSRAFALAYRHTIPFHSYILPPCSPAFSQTKVIIDTEHGQIVGTANAAEGKRTTIRSYHGTFSGTAQRIRVVGKEELTISERAREEFILLLLQGHRSLRHSLFTRLLWFPEEKEYLILGQPKKNSEGWTRPRLNESQDEAVDAIVDEDVPLVIVHGILFHP